MESVRSPSERRERQKAKAKAKASPGEAPPSLAGVGGGGGCTQANKDSADKANVTQSHACAKMSQQSGEITGSYFIPQGPALSLLVQYALFCCQRLSDCP